MNIQQAADECRVGQFQITYDCINMHSDDAMMILAGCLVIGAIADSASQTVRYTAINANFDAIPRITDQIPQYTALVAPDVDLLPPVRSWRRVSP